MARDRVVRLEVQRQDGPSQPKYWQRFEVPWEPHDRRVDRVVTERCIHPEEPRARQGAEG